MKWEMVIGLETHVELATETKVFCSCTTQFGGEPNTHCCPVCTGQPGAMPSLNRKAVEYTVMAGLALGCEISRVSKMDRKHYVYPDLPKAFQISQYDLPFCLGGGVTLSDGKRIQITRIHLEEDAGKLIHENGKVLIDYNRGGVPLIEIVSEPDLSSAQEAVEYLEKLQLILRTIGVSDCRMQEGSMRCDVNLSVREQGNPNLGTRTEVKNLNSFSSVLSAIDYEFKRQTALLEDGLTILQETLHFNPSTGETVNMRGKENADDYRYFREPDITAILLSPEDIDRLRARLPELPDSKIRRYVQEYGLSSQDAALLCKYKKVSDFFEAASEGTGNRKAAASFILTQMFSLISTEVDREVWETPIPPGHLRALILLLNENKLNRNLSKRVFAKMLETGEDPERVMLAEGISANAPVSVETLCKSAIKENQPAVNDYRNGKEKALQALIGHVMRASKGSADAEETKQTLIALLNE
jgi:aspartyl-tRNA(Asn)/glutamyl-tRNA(Gln) amidotransferase subunit B